MSFDADQPQNPYAPPGADLHPPEMLPPGGQKQSGLGIVSFAIAILGGIAVLALIVVAGVMEASAPGGMDEESTAVIMVGLGILAAMAAHFVGAVLAIAGLMQSGRAKTFAVLGLIFNGLVILGICGLLGLGLAMGA